MLENLRRKSLTKTYHNPTHQVYFEQGLARYENHAEIDVYTQKLSKEKPPESLFPRVIDTISLKSFSYFKLGMIYCPKGTFVMGHRTQNDNQPRNVKIKSPFLLGETEITQELYQAVMGTNPSHFKNNPQNPIEMVSWYDAILFCNELSRLQGLNECYTKNSSQRSDCDWLCDFSKNGYRLPEEKEWEYAAKASTENRWAGTDDASKLKEYAWFGENYNIGSTHPVKMKKPNEWGFYDMSGNVEEWCWDADTDPDPQRYSPAYRVHRGGSWTSEQVKWVISAVRNIDRFGSRGNCRGFRVCRSIVS